MIVDDLFVVPMFFQNECSFKGKVNNHFLGNRFSDGGS